MHKAAPKKITTKAAPKKITKKSPAKTPVSQTLASAWPVLATAAIAPIRSTPVDRTKEPKKVKAKPKKDPVIKIKVNRVLTKHQVDLLLESVQSELSDECGFSASRKFPISLDTLRRNKAVMAAVDSAVQGIFDHTLADLDEEDGAIEDIVDAARREFQSELDALEQAEADRKAEENVTFTVKRKNKSQAERLLRSAGLL